METDFKKIDKAIPTAVDLYIKKKWENFKPDVCIFCRYSGPGAQLALNLAKKHKVKTLMSLDDDLINVPKELGEAKYKYHSHPDRVNRVRQLIENCDLIYSSTENLTARIKTYCKNTPIFTANCFCPAVTDNPPVRNNGEKVFGYMGFGHAIDLKIALPSITSLLEKRTDFRFQLFGTIPRPIELEKFGDRVELIEPVREYTGFINKLASLKWHVGICPLSDLPFNSVKANTKWIEYTSCGIATVASNHPAYKSSVEDGCGVLISDNDAWAQHIEKIMDSEDFRITMVEKAQKKVRVNYNKKVFDTQISELFSTLNIDLTLKK